MTTKNTDRATPAELQTARDDVRFPADLDWGAEYTVRQHQRPGSRIKMTAEDWLLPVNHPYATTEDLIQGQAEPYIYDTLGPGLHIAHAQEIVLTDGEITTIVTMHPATVNRSGDPSPADDQTLAKAEVTIRFHSNRTNELVRAALEAITPFSQPSEDTAPPAPDRNLPDGLDWQAEYTVLADPDDPQSMTAAWTEALTEGATGLRSALTGAHTAAAEIAGNNLVYQFQFRLDGGNMPVADASLHPAEGPGLEPNLDRVIASAEIRIRPADPRTTAAVVQYITEHHA